jgi:hypothetical protein
MSRRWLPRRCLCAETGNRSQKTKNEVMLEQVPGDGRITVGGDKGFDTAEFIELSIVGKSFLCLYATWHVVYM